MFCKNPFVAAQHGSQLVLVFALSILLTMVVRSDSVSACLIARFIILAQKPCSSDSFSISSTKLSSKIVDSILLPKGTGAKMGITQRANSFFASLHFPRFGLSCNTKFETLKWKLFINMLRQYQLHGGIHRLRPQFGQSKQFGRISTMAASAAPTPWNPPPPSIDNFRWWDNIFLNFSGPLTTNEPPKIHRKRFLAEPHNGKTHKLLELALKESFPYLFSSFEKVQVDRTLKTSHFHQPQNAHHHCFRCIRSNLLKNSTVNNPIRHIHPISTSRGVDLISQQLPKHSHDRLQNQEAKLLGWGTSVPQGSKVPEVSLQVRPPCHCYRAHCPLYGPVPTNSQTEISARIDKNRGGQGIKARNPRDFYGPYIKTFHFIMTSNDKEIESGQSTGKTKEARPCSRSRSQSAPKTNPKSGHGARAATIPKTSSSSTPFPERLNLRETKETVRVGENIWYIFPSCHSASISRSTCKHHGSNSLRNNQLHGSRQETSRQLPWSQLFWEQLCLHQRSSN